MQKGAGGGTVKESDFIQAMQEVAHKNGRCVHPPPHPSLHGGDRDREK